MRELLGVSVLGLGGAGGYFLSIAVDRSAAPQAATYGLVAGLVSWGIAAILLIIGMFALRGRE
jgi:hypothetical protein